MKNPPVKKKGRKHTKSTPHRKKLFLETLSYGWSVTHACEVSGLDRSSVYKWRGKTTIFDQGWKDALAKAQDRREDELNLRAFEGLDVPIVYQGEIMKERKRKNGVERPIMLKKKSDSLLMFVMKAEDPDKYKEKSAVEHLGLETLADQFKALQAASNKADSEQSSRDHARSDQQSSDQGDDKV